MKDSDNFLIILFKYLKIIYKELASKERANMDDGNTENYKDYYKHVEQSKAIRPISITENVNFNDMSFGQKLYWWLTTFLKVSILYNHSSIFFLP